MLDVLIRNARVYDGSGGKSFQADVGVRDGAIVDVGHTAEPARQKGIRVVNSRFGVILSARGGALAKMLTPFKLGVGGVVGSGRQYMSCIALDDCVAAIQHARHA